MIRLVAKDADLQRAVKRHQANARVLDAVGRLLVQQVRSRFATSGRSGGVTWPVTFLSQMGVSRKPRLGGPDSTLARSFDCETSAKSVRVASHDRNAIRHQLGTLSKGGKLNDVKPVRAKALFIPITEAARQSSRFYAGDAVIFRAFSRPGRMPQLLKKGRLTRDGLEVYNEQEDEYEPGIPDFIFLKKASYAPTPMLPDSRQEQREQKNLITLKLKG